MTSENPHLASTGLKLFELIEVNDPTHTEAQLNTTTSAMGTAQTNYNNAETAETTATNNYNSEVTACVIPGLPDDGYLRGATALAPLATHLVTPQDQTRDINYSDRSYYGPSPPTQNQDQLLDQYINNQNLSSNVNKNAPMDWSGYQSWNTTPQQMNWIRNQNQQLQG